MTPTNTEALAIAEALEKRLDCSSLVLTADVERAAAELRRLAGVEAERDALLADAERYQWLRQGDNDEEVLRFHDWATEVCVDPPPMYLPRLERLDKLIDAAMKGTQ